MRMWDLSGLGAKRETPNRRGLRSLELKSLPRVPGIFCQSLLIHVHKYYLNWALKSVHITYIGLYGSLGNDTKSLEASQN